MIPEVKVTHAAVQVVSVKNSIDFFQKALGVKPAWSGSQDWGMVKSAGSTLALIEGEQKKHPPHIGFVVPNKEDVDTMHQHLKDSGAKEVSDPKDHRDQSRSFYFKDPDGNQFELLWLPEGLTR